ncbi:MAG: chorismate mutase [Clostridiaceae bacterium]
MIAIRGATTVERDEINDIKEASLELFENILRLNSIDKDDIISLTISCTNDIKSCYPGKYIREEYNLLKAGIMHFNEMEVNGSLKMAIRFLVLADCDKKDNIEFVYLKGAKDLRKR